MKAQVRRLELIGANRQVSFSPGLNIVTGPITSGKTSLLRLCRGLFGGPLDRMPVEVREHVVAVTGEIQIGESSYAIVRPQSTRPSARVEIAGPNEAYRLPLSEPDEIASITYGQWLLGKLGLPIIEVPSAPSRVDSPPTPISINDYFLYCDLPQDEIDTAVFGHQHPFKNIKRRYVFEILYGLYSAETAQLQEQLRDVFIRLRQLQNQSVAVSQFLADTPWENRARLEETLVTSRERLAALETEIEHTARLSQQRESSGTRELRSRVQEVDRQISDVDGRRSKERSSIDRLKSLYSQLQTQSERLTRSIVADQILSDFEFVVCPRCGTSVEQQRSASTACYLCLQVPGQSLSKEMLIREQDRIGAQIEETRELLQNHESAGEHLDRELRRLEQQREAMGRELDLQVRTFVSDSAAEIQSRAKERADLQAAIRRLQDYLRLYEKLDAVVGQAATLEEQRRELEEALQRSTYARSDAENRMRALERKFEEVLAAFRVPRFGDVRKVSIDRRTFLPVVDGRPFDELSSQGLQVLVNVAHAVAHQETALEFGIPLPNILIIDGLTKNVGHEGFDLERVNDVYGYLMRLSEREADRLQLIVADNDVPSQAEPHVRVRLSENDRLVRFTP
jgi:hypothetical protein